MATTTSLTCGDVLDFLISLPDNSADFCFTSPPYALKTERYGEGSKKMGWPEWCIWMRSVIDVACQKTNGFVGVVSNNPVKDGRMIPANETLVTFLDAMGVHCERRVVWTKNSAPSRCSGSKQWFSNAYEDVMFFFHKDKRPKTWNWEAIAEPPKYSNGGRFRQRDQKGNRRLGGMYPTSKLARPKDVHCRSVGGGHMGSKLAHKQEAAFPEKLVEPFILALTNPGDTVLDPFCGSGTTLAVAKRLGRNGIGCDSRESQIALTEERLGVT